jgi:hypothetical protein
VTTSMARRCTALTEALATGRHQQRLCAVFKPRIACKGGYRPIIGDHAPNNMINVQSTNIIQFAAFSVPNLLNVVRMHRVETHS